MSKGKIRNMIIRFYQNSRTNLGETLSTSGREAETELEYGGTATLCADQAGSTSKRIQTKMDRPDMELKAIRECESILKKVKVRRI